MTKEDFLQIFKTGFHKLSLKKVKKLGKFKNKNGKIYYKFLGKFVFVPPNQIWNDNIIDYDFLRSLLEELKQETSNCITRKFTKKIIRNNEILKKKVFRYVFDVIPENIVSFSFNKEKKTMNLIVKGWGLFQ